MSNKFIKNTTITFATRILNLLLGTGASVIIARVLGPSGKGIYSLVLLLPAMIFMFSHLGIGAATVYYVAQKKYSVKDIFNSNIVLGLLISILSILAGLIIIFFFQDEIVPGVPKKYLLLALLLLPLKIFTEYIINILLGLQKIKKFNLINPARTLTFLVLIIILLLGFGFGIMAAIVASIISLVVSGSLTFYWTFKETNILTKISLKLNKSYIKNIFSYVFKTYLSAIFNLLHLRFDMFMINLYLTPMAVGFYSIAVGLTEKLWLISQSAGLVLFPRVSSEKDPKKFKQFTPLVFRTSILLTAGAAIILFFWGHQVIMVLFSKSFSSSIQPFKILLIGIIATSGSRILGNDLFGRGKPMLNTYAAAVSVILNISLNIFWIPRWGIIGAAWATAISYNITLLMTIIMYSRVSGNSLAKIIFIQKSDLHLYKRLILVLIKFLKNKI